jgi:prephenate dehydrogenase
VSGPRFERLAIIGLGLLGGSVALAAKRRGLAATVVGSGRREAPLQRALDAGVVDEIGDLAHAVRGADLIVLATPVGAMASLVEAAAPHLAEGALVTDVGSVKAPLAETLPGLLPASVHYIGAHPMAGSHERGNAHAREDLFEGAACAVTPHEGSDDEACERIQRFWRGLGARVFVRDPALHDLEVAWTSHAPHLVAFAFAQSLASAPQGTGVLAGGGFRDFTRIARSDAELWGDILTANRKPLAGPIHAFGEALTQLARILEEGNADELERSLAAAREALAPVAQRAAMAQAEGGAADDARFGGDNPEIKAAKASSQSRK